MHIHMPDRQWDGTPGVRVVLEDEPFVLHIFTSVIVSAGCEPALYIM